MLSNSFQRMCSPKCYLEFHGPKKSSVLHISAPHFKIFTERKINERPPARLFFAMMLLTRRKDNNNCDRLATKERNDSLLHKHASSICYKYIIRPFLKDIHYFHSLSPCHMKSTSYRPLGTHRVPGTC